MNDWNHTFHREIPDCEGSIIKDVESQWKNYLNEIQTYVSNIAPSIKAHLLEMYPSLEGIKEEMRDRVRRALKMISEGSADVHPYFTSDVRDTMTPIFDEALLIRGKDSKSMQKTYSNFL